MARTPARFRRERWQIGHRRKLIAIKSRTNTHVAFRPGQISAQSSRRPSRCGGGSPGGSAPSAMSTARHRASKLRRQTPPPEQACPLPPLFRRRLPCRGALTLPRPPTGRIARGRPRSRCNTASGKIPGGSKRFSQIARYQSLMPINICRRNRSFGDDAWTNGASSCHGRLPCRCRNCGLGPKIPCRENDGSLILRFVFLFHAAGTFRATRRNSAFLRRQNAHRSRNMRKSLFFSCSQGIPTELRSPDTARTAGAPNPTRNRFGGRRSRAASGNSARRSG